MAKNKNSNSAERKTQIFYKFVSLYIFRVAKSEMRLHFIRNMDPGKVFHVKSPENDDRRISKISKADLF